MTARLLLGDCLELLPTIEANSVGLVLADLPYGTTQNKWDSVIGLDRLWPELWRVLRPNGAAVLTSQGVFTAQLIMSQARHFKYKLTWVKSKATGFLGVKYQPMRKTEDVCIFYRKQPSYNPEMSPGEPYDKGVRKAGAGNYGSYDSCLIKSDGGRHPSDVIYFSSAGHGASGGSSGTFHPTQKPVPLGRYLVRTYSDPGDVVLDVTCGSGSFLVAAICERREAVGIELSEAFLNIARARIKHAAPGQEVEGGEDPTPAAGQQVGLFG
jgi:site-specific DNA-methyltransferase (adenine-specific)